MSSAGEQERLESIQRSTDAHTVSVLEGLSPAPDWHCLELGAGAGSIAYWLAERCPDGRVVAVDIDTHRLDGGRAPNLVVQEADVTCDDFAPGGFDLIHARYLFCHLPERDRLVARAAGRLAPGGRLVVEEPYQLPADTSPFPVVRRLMAAYGDRLGARGTDLTWARGLPALLARSGLEGVDFTGRLACMGGLAKDRWRPIIAQAAPGLLAEGALTEADLEEFERLLDDPAFVDIPQFTVSAWGRSPEQQSPVPSAA